MKTSRLILLFILTLALALALASCEVKTAETTDQTTDVPATEAEISETAEGIETADETTLSETQAATTAATTAAATTVPATSAKPATTAAPATTAKPATTAAPATTAKPAATTVPATEPPAPEVVVPTMASSVKEPKAGDDPKKLSGIENVMRIAYVLQHAENYSMDGSGTVKTKVGSGWLSTTYTQDVKVYKDYKDGVLIEIDVTDSSFVSNAWQICYVGDQALSREPSSSSSSDWKGRKTAWKTGTPTTYTRDGYRSQYGLFGFELTNYLLTPDTVTKWGSVTDNGDGTYTQTVEPDLTKSTGDVVVRMKTMGGLSDKPKFKKSSITLTFDGNWRILSMRIKETYSAKMSVINADSCEADTTYTYSYGNADTSAYTSFFSKYVK